MRIAAVAVHLAADHAVARVGLASHVFFPRRLPEARPAAAGLELVLRAEQLGPAAYAAVLALVVVVPVLAGERALGAVLARHLELLRRELAFPFCIRLRHFLGRRTAVLRLGFSAHALLLLNS